MHRAPWPHLAQEQAEARDDEPQRDDRDAERTQASKVRSFARWSRVVFGLDGRSGPAPLCGSLMQLSYPPGTLHGRITCGKPSAQKRRPLCRHTERTKSAQPRERHPRYPAPPAAPATLPGRAAGRSSSGSSSASATSCRSSCSPSSWPTCWGRWCAASPAPRAKGSRAAAAALVVYLIVIAILGVALSLLYSALRSEIESLRATTTRTTAPCSWPTCASEEAHGLLRACQPAPRTASTASCSTSAPIAAGLFRKTLPGLVKTAPARCWSWSPCPIVAYYLLTDYQRFIDFVRRLVRPGGARALRRARPRHQQLAARLPGRPGHALARSPGSAAFLILQLNGVRPALVVGIAAVFLELIPVVGPLAWALARSC